MINLQNTNVQNREAIKEEIISQINTFKDRCDYRVFGYKFAESQDVGDYGCPSIYIDVDMVTPGSFRINVSIVDEIYHYTRKLDEEWYKFFKGGFDGRCMTALERIVDSVVSGLDCTATMLQEVISISTDGLYGSQLVYDCEVTVGD